MNYAGLLASLSRESSLFRPPEGAGAGWYHVTEK